MTRPRIAATLACALALAVPGAAAAADGSKGITDVKLFGINDFHGALEPPGSFVSLPTGQRVPVGGAEYLSTHLQDLRDAAEDDGNPSLTVEAGDLVGASPLLSALFHDEPTVEAANRMGMGLGVVGNHEFDEGLAELARLRDGGCHPTDGCADGTGFAGASFPVLAANVVSANTGEPISDPYMVKRLGGVKVGFIGVVLKDTPTIVTPSGVAGLKFLNETQTVNKYAAELERQGVKAIVVLAHQGALTRGGYNDCQSPQGPAELFQGLDPEVDAIFSGHTHNAYICRFGGVLTTQAGNNGRFVTDMTLRVDRKTDQVISASAQNVPVTQDVGKDARITRLIARYQKFAAPIANRVVGRITADLTRDTTPAGESTLGDAIADAQLAFTKGSGGAQAAFMNPGGIRTDLKFAPSGSEAPGETTFGEIFSVQPFGNSLVTETLTGAQVDQLLEQQFQGTSPRILQVSDGVSYRYSPSAPVGSRVDIGSIRIAGTPVTATGRYRITVNSFLADGGDGFTVLKEGTNRTGGGQDLDAFEAYLKAKDPLAPTPRDRFGTTP